MSQPIGSTGVKRRDFLKVLGAAGAATTTIGCSQERVEQLIPYLVSPDQTVPGVSSHYATTCRECSAGCGVISETRDGRAIKLEGNVEHPVNRGALCARGQAALQGLYNPDRYRGPMVRENGRLVPTTWDRAVQLLSTRLGEARSRGGAANAIFLNRHESGSFPAFLDEWLAGFGMGPHISYDGELSQSTQMANREAYGVDWPRLDFSAARLVVAIGADFLDTWGASVPQQLDFADARAKLEGAPRFVYIGARRSLTGLNADEWIAAKPGSELAIANFLAGRGTADQAATASGVTAATLQRLATELASARPNLVLAGATTPDALEVARAVAAINQAQGNVGTTIRPSEAVTAMSGAAGAAVLGDAVRRMSAGNVPVLMIRNVNPVYEMPKSAQAAQAIARVPFKVSFSSYPDETTDLCDLVLPDHHSLEAWGDAQPVRGTIGLQQPVMDPVFDTRPTGDVLIAVAKGDPTVAARYPMSDYRSWLMARFPGGQTAFTAGLQRGLAAGDLPAATRATPPATTPVTVPAPLEGQQGDYYLVVYPSPTLGDGRGANKPWLQELPDPVTKICWQSWVEVHPATARRLGILPGDHVKVDTSAGSVTAPAYPYLGIRPDTIGLALGQGHTSYGRYARNVGVNALDVLPAATDASGGLPLTSQKARLTRTGDHAELVTTEGSARQHGRGIAQAILVSDLGAGIQIREGAGAERADEIATGGTEGAGRGIEPRGGPGVNAPDSATRQGDTTGGRSTEQGTGGGHDVPAQTGGEHGGGHEFKGDASHEFLPGLRSPVANDAQGDLGDPDSKDKGMYDPNHWSGMAKRRWAMTIDLARCTGCSACITACYAENNIPTVGATWQGRSLRPFHTSDGSGWDTRPGANIAKGREMTWIRIERYFEGGEDGSSNFETRFAPMLCQHCGNAPCEPVCPVYATYHSPDGLNVQVYNRCVGTRYCSNGCPYKVRYYNWHGFGEPARRQYAFPEPLNWQLNPDVTVRGKGVMEKCTFCVQRIREAENLAAQEKRAVRPDEFTVACAQACPSRAIVFGDAADPAWTVARLAQDRRAYHVFEELNTYTAVVYLKKVTHPAPGATTATAPAPAEAH